VKTVKALSGGSKRKNLPKTGFPMALKKEVIGV
jgi:hypothetical protein